MHSPSVSLLSFITFQYFVLNQVKFFLFISISSFYYPQRWVGCYASIKGASCCLRSCPLGAPLLIAVPGPYSVYPLNLAVSQKSAAHLPELTYTVPGGCCVLPQR
jgi:hypothetical protein